MPLNPLTATVPWYETFSVVTVDVTTPDASTTSTASDGVVTQTDVAPTSSTIVIVSVRPELEFPPEPTVIINTGLTSFTLSGIYKNMMGTEHSWKDNNDILQTSIVPPELGTYEKIVGVVSPALQLTGKPWNYIVETTFDQVVTATVTSVVSSSTVIGLPVSSTVTTIIGVLTGTSIRQSSSAAVPVSPTSTNVIATVTSVSTTTQNATPWPIKTETLSTVTTVRNITTSTIVEGTSTTSTFIMKVTHTTYNTIRDKILDPLVLGQPEPPK
jgi:hypothetical protein